jgi:GNAT superfamily N-acetyltransferase
VIVFEDARVDSGDGAMLAQQMKDEIATLYDVPLDDPTMPKAGPAELNPPHGAFLVGYEDGLAICCGGIKRLDAEACEIKRMYVIPGARGRGVARELLVVLEQRARSLGFTVARLDTGPKQPGAQRIYERSGYATIPDFNGNPVATFFGEKRL